MDTKRREIKNQIFRLKQEIKNLEKQLDRTKPNSSIKHIKSFEDACNYLGNDNKFVKQYHNCGALDAPGYAYFKLQIITAALNNEPDGWKPNYNNYDYEEGRWFVEFDLGGFNDPIFCGYCAKNEYDIVRSGGCRLCYKTFELAEYSAIQFKDIWYDFLIAK